MSRRSGSGRPWWYATTKSSSTRCTTPTPCPTRPPRRGSSTPTCSTAQVGSRLTRVPLPSLEPTAVIMAMNTRGRFQDRPLFVFFRGEITPLSSSYNISGLVPVCWLLFNAFDWNQRTFKKWIIWPCPGFILTTDWAKLIKNYTIISISMTSWIVHFYIFQFRLIFL